MMGVVLAILFGSQAYAEEKMVTLPSGLKYTQVKTGDGSEAMKGKQVSVHYTGWLNEAGKKGKEFDSSMKRNEPFQFMLGAGQVIAGWDEGVSGMKIGEKRTLQIPAKLAYGDRGVPGVIPPNAELIFDVELLGVN